MNEPDSNTDEAAEDPAAAPRPAVVETFGVRTAALAGKFIGAASAVGLGFWLEPACSSTTTPTFG